MTTDPRPRGLAALDPLPEIPEELAELSLSALMLALVGGPRLDVDPHAAAKVANFDRLLFRRMPILCDGPGRVMQIGGHGEQ